MPTWTTFLLIATCFLLLGTAWFLFVEISAPLSEPLYGSLLDPPERFPWRILLRLSIPVLLGAGAFHTISANIESVAGPGEISLFLQKTFFRLTELQALVWLWSASVVQFRNTAKNRKRLQFLRNTLVKTEQDRRRIDDLRKTQENQSLQQLPQRQCLPGQQIGSPRTHRQDQPDLDFPAIQNPEQPPKVWQW